MVSRRFLSVDPPDLSLWPTAKGLARLWREQGRLVVVGLVCAFVWTGLALAIPLVIQRAIDHVDRADERPREPRSGRTS